MTESEMRFHIEEYKELRKEVLDKITKAETLVQSSVLIAAAVFSWLATRGVTSASGAAATSTMLTTDNLLVRMAWWIPFAAAVIIGLLGLAQYMRIKEMGEYLGKLEAAMGHSKLGWEKFLSAKSYTVSPAFVLAWLVVFVGTGGVALYAPEAATLQKTCDAAQKILTPPSSAPPSAPAGP